jgi:hypothetical protein
MALCEEDCRCCFCTTRRARATAGFVPDPIIRRDVCPTDRNCGCNIPGYIISLTQDLARAERRPPLPPSREVANFNEAVAYMQRYAAAQSEDEKLRHEAMRDRWAFEKFKAKRARREAMPDK